MQFILKDISAGSSTTGLDIRYLYMPESDVSPNEIFDIRYADIPKEPNLGYYYSPIKNATIGDVLTITVPVLLKAIVVSHEIGHTLASGNLGLDFFDPLEDVYSYRIRVINPKIILEYLLANRDIVSLIKSVCRDTRKAFGTKAALTLELYIDPEIDDTHLVLYVKAKKDIDAIFDTIDNVLENYNDKFIDIGRRIRISPDYKNR